MTRQDRFPTTILVAVVALAGCPGEPAPEASCAPRFADTAAGPSLDEDTCAAIAALRLPDTLPAARGNAHGDDEDAALLGFAVFFDARFSANQDVRCASCHEPEAHFDDDEPRSTAGLGDVARNSPTVLNAAWHRVQFWDGRADSLWSQPLFAFEADNEIGFSRLELAHRMSQSYRAAYEALFGPLPALDDAARFPAAGKPGTASWDAMTSEDQHAVDVVAANVGKALEAYMRKVASGPSRLDAWLDGDDDALTNEERSGLGLFATQGCIACHAGPLLSDERFHNLGLAGVEGLPEERGRASGARVLAESVFSLRGAFADDRPDDVPSTEELLDEALDPASLGAIRTPSLRNLARSAPYGHDGSWATLEDAIAHHLAGEKDASAPGELDALVSEKRALDEDEVASIVTFLAALDGQYPPTPWNNWPDR